MIPDKWRQKLQKIIFEVDTPAGKAFDLLLLGSILASVFAVVMESVASIRLRYGTFLLTVEWLFTLLFSVEYVLRIITVPKPVRYIFSFYGAVDLLAVLPTYLSLFIPGTQALLVVRALRLLRVFRILKLSHFLGEAKTLSTALRESARKITVFLGTVLILVLILGSLMYLIEGEKNGFTSIPQAIYWAIVTLTTVGYGDIAPATIPGKILASAVMITGYCIIAVPTGIVTVELSRNHNKIGTRAACPACGSLKHDRDARFCKLCGAPL